MRDRLRLDVALVPSLLPRPSASGQCVYVAVDVVRATTTLSVLFERGARRVLIASSISDAREARARLGPGYLLAGEAGGLPPAGFDLGNSPAQIAAADVAGREIIFATSNGTIALRACEGGRAIFAGALRNAREVMSRAVAAVPAHAPSPEQAATTGEASEAALEQPCPDIIVVCSGRGGRPAYDDTLCAGALIEETARLLRDAGAECDLGEGARLARAVWRHEADAGGVEDALAASDAGQAVLQVGLGVDLGWCAARDVATVAPRVTGRLPGTALLAMEVVAGVPD